MADSANENIRKRHIERQRKRIRQIKRRRYTTVSVLILIILFIIIFFTPIFKIRRIETQGNQRVSVEEIEGKLEGCMGKNIFRYRTGQAVKNIKTIPYIDTVEIKKSVFSSKVTVNVTECVPAAYFEAGEKKILVDKQLKVLEVVEDVAQDVPKITDVSVVQVNPGNGVGLENDDIFNTVKTSVLTISNEGLLEGVEYISFKDSNNITFNYEERLDVICGNTDNFEKKIKLFNQAIHTEKLSDKSRGTIDLSVSGQAVYTP